MSNSLNQEVKLPSALVISFPECLSEAGRVFWGRRDWFEPFSRKTKTSCLIHPNGFMEIVKLPVYVFCFPSSLFPIFFPMHSVFLHPPPSMSLSAVVSAWMTKSSNRVDRSTVQASAAPREKKCFHHRPTPSTTPPPPVCVFARVILSQSLIGF